MGDDILKGTTYSEGEQVNAANLNAHVDNATIKYTAISSKILKDPAALSDELLINDGGILKKITLQQISGLVTIPVGSIMDYAGSTAPTGWLLCYGQAVSRITYAALFSSIGATYGAGDGASTFNLPDCRGRVSAGKDNMGGTSANRMTTQFNGDVLGAAGGGEYHVLTQAEIASHVHLIGAHQHNVLAHQHYTSGVHAHGMSATVGGYVSGGSIVTSVSGSGQTVLIGPAAHTASTCLGAAPGWSDAGYGATTTDAQAASNTGATGSNNAHNNVQPSIVFNKIIKI